MVNEEIKNTRKEEAKHTTKLVLDTVQLEGKSPVTWKQFSEGYPEAIF